MSARCSSFSSSRPLAASEPKILDELHRLDATQEEPPPTDATAELAAVPVAVHLDHVQSPELLPAVDGTGISSVMFDASSLDYAANVSATAAAVGWAHGRGLWLEAELGEVGGKDGAHAPGVRTDPAEAAEFVAATGVDALAVAVGRSPKLAQTRRLTSEPSAALRQ